MTTDPAADFAVRLGLYGRYAVLGVIGDVDVRSAPTLGSVLGVLVDQGHPRVVLDLAALTFMDAAGLGVIANASTHLRTSGRVLTVRSAPEETLRLLEITGLTELVELEASAPNQALGAEQGSDEPAVAVSDGSAQLVSDLARVGSIPASSGVIDAALGMVTKLAVATVDGADGVSVSLARHGRLATVASTNDTVQRMDDHQYETGEGPCLAAAAEGHWFHIESLAEEDRWPTFVPRAMEEGIASILSTPLLTADRPLGALNIYSNTERAFKPPQQELAALFAAQASGILGGAGVDVTDEQKDRRIAQALRSREVIAQAQGVIMACHNITPADAAAMLHRAAREAGIPVLRHANEVVASLRLDDDPDE